MRTCKCRVRSQMPGSCTNAAYRDSSDPKKCIQQILAIAPILPESESGSLKAPHSTASNPRSSTSAEKSSRHPPADNLIDLDSRPSSTNPEKQKAMQSPDSNPMHPTSNPQQLSATPVHQQTAIQQPLGNAQKTGSLMDDHHDLNDKMSNLNMNHEPMRPKALQRTDTETSEVDEFVDAQG